MHNTVQMRLTAISFVAMLCSNPAFAAHVCPDTGSATSQLARAVDILKNRRTPPSPSAIDNSAKLEKLLEPGEDRDRWNHDKGAEITGYVILVKPGGIETANCKARDLLHRDVHIEIALTKDAKKNEGVIVEVTPWGRADHPDWTAAKLKPKLLHKKVTIKGWLMDDIEHWNAAENTNPHHKANWRGTIWEIHPITSIMVDQ